MTMLSRSRAAARAGAVTLSIALAIACERESAALPQEPTQSTSTVATSEGGQAGKAAAPVATSTQRPSGTAGVTATARPSVAGTAGDATPATASAGSSAASAGSLAAAGMGSSGSAGDAQPAAAGTFAAAGSAAAGQGGTGGLPAAGTHADAGRAAFAPSGMPITAPARTWTWIEFPDTKCRDGSPSGISVNLDAESKKVVLYFEGGGACFNRDTCEALVSPNNIPIGSRNPGNSGIFDRLQADNPVKDWSYVYLPYCTGDVFLGDNDAGMIEGLNGTQHFNGRPNLEAFFHRLRPTFPDATQVMLTGISAGGFGAMWSSDYVQWAWGSIPVTVIDDSGPPMSNRFVPQCLTDIQVEAWKLERTTVAECGSDCTADGDTQAQNLLHFAKAQPARTIALIETDADSVIRGFFGVGVNNGKNDCGGTLDVIAPMMPADLFQAGLRDYRSKIEAYPQFSTFFIENTTKHTWLRDDSMYGLQAVSEGVRLSAWLSDVLDGKPGKHLGLK